MQQYSTSTKEHLVKGIAPDNTAPDGRWLLNCVGAMPTVHGLARPHLVSKLLGTGSTLYSTQVINVHTTGVHVLLTDQTGKLGIHNCQRGVTGTYEIGDVETGFINLFIEGRVLYPIHKKYMDSCHTADSGFMTDGDRCGYLLSEATDVRWWDVDQGSIPNCVAVFNNRYIYGGLSPISSEAVCDLLVKYSAIQTVLPIADILRQSILIGAPNTGSFDSPILLDVSILCDYKEDLIGEIVLDSIRKGDLSLTFFDGIGEVCKVIPMGRRLIVYGTNCIYSYVIGEQPVLLHPDGIESVISVDGDDIVHGGFLQTGELFKYTEQEGFVVQSFSEQVDTALVEPAMTEIVAEVVRDNISPTIYTTTETTTVIGFGDLYVPENGYVINAVLPPGGGVVTLTDGVTEFEVECVFDPGAGNVTFAFSALNAECQVRAGGSIIDVDVPAALPQFSANVITTIGCPIGTAIALYPRWSKFTCPLLDNEIIYTLSSPSLGNLQYDFLSTPDAVDSLRISSQPDVTGTIDFVKGTITPAADFTIEAGEISPINAIDGAVTFNIADYNTPRRYNPVPPYDYNYDFTYTTAIVPLLVNKAMVDKKHHIIYYTTQSSTYTWTTGLAKRHEYIWGIFNHEYNDDTLACLCTGDRDDTFFITLYPMEFGRKTRKTIQQLEIRGSLISTLRASVRDEGEEGAYDYKKIDSGMVIYPMATATTPAISIAGSFDAKSSVLSDVIVKWQARDMTHDRGLIQYGNGGDDNAS